MGAGGYVAGPVVVAALALRVPVLLTEADSRLGLTNRLLAPFARRVCLSFPPAGRLQRALAARPAGARARKFRVTGRPIPFPLQERERSRAALGLGDGEAFVLVFGGSLGARSINEAAVDAFAEGSSPAPRILHVCGRRDFEVLSRGRLRAGYDLVAYLEVSDFERALAAADLVVARSGGSVFEIAAYGAPAVLVPYPHAAGDHQSENARWMSDAGAAVTIRDRELSPERLLAEVRGLLDDGERLTSMRGAALAIARPRAALDVAGEVLEIAR